MPAALVRVPERGDADSFKVIAKTVQAVKIMTDGPLTQTSFSP